MRMMRARMPGSLGLLAAAATFAPAAAPQFYRDVLPILQNRCQECHRPGEIGPMPLVTYRDARPWAKAIREQVAARRMPPWFADPCCGKFSNDRTLSAAEIATITQWAEAGAPAGDPRDAPPPRLWPARGALEEPDAVLAIPQVFPVPAKGELDYQRFVIPTGFDGDRWVQATEVRPGARSVIHHVVVYIREVGDTWVKGVTQSDMLAVWAPGNPPEVWPAGTAKLIPKGADLIMEIHYTPNGRAAQDRTSVAMTFAKSRPSRRVLTLQMNELGLDIPPGDPDYHVTVSGTLPNDALLLGFFPHMHLRGKAFEYDLIRQGRPPEPLMRVSHYNFYWQMSCRLAKPIALTKGTRLSITAWYDNSANNPLNPDASAEVRWGEQSSAEMMVGFFDVAVDPSFDRNSFFVRKNGD